MSIKSVEYQLKLNVDCNIFYQRNFFNDPSLDNTRDCEYNNCDYVCNYFDNNSTPINPYTELDYSTFNEYYNSKKIVSSYKNLPIYLKYLISFYYPIL